MKISVVTATYNAMEYLPNLVESLRNQRDKSFEWVVADGNSADGTLEFLKSIKDLNVKISSQKDFGIYDALNRAISISGCDYYLVVGADDILYENAIESYQNAIKNGDADIVTACISMSGKVVGPRKWGAWLCGQGSYVSGHAVGTIFKKDLHNKFGWYSRKFPIAADQFFILSCVKGGAKVKKINYLVGEFNRVGVSSVDKIGSLTECYRIALMLGENKLVQNLLLFFRIIKNQIFSK